jgi:hypothetical protein
MHVLRSIRWVGLLAKARARDAFEFTKRGYVII